MKERKNQPGPRPGRASAHPPRAAFPAAFAAAVAALAALAAPARAGFPLENVQNWAGEGTNRVAVVVDWGRDDASAVRAWGYRWNGEATAADAILAIAAADARLDLDSSASAYGLLLSGFVYRAPDGDVYEAAAEDYYDESGSMGTYWSLSSAVPGGEMALSGTGASALALAPGGRVGLKWTYYSFDYATYDYDGGDTSVAEDSAVAAPAAAFTLDDVHFWAGAGANRAAIVVDFSRDGYSPRAWGFRWDGDKTVADALRAIAQEDNRFHAFIGGTSYGAALYALGYDLADRAAAFIFDYNGGVVRAGSSDSAAFASGGWYNGYWSQWTAPVAPEFDAASLGYGSGIDATPLADGSWHVLQFQRPEWGWDTHALSGTPLPAESPYGWRVAAADVAAGPYGNPENALGRPARSVPGWGAIPPTTVNPASAAWATGDLVTLETESDDDIGGSITIEFDHDVVDDPRNPFGLDFIVFGNAMQTLGGGVYFEGNADPSGVTFRTALVNSEPGLVEVSADGETWFSFEDGPFADDFAPTLSHRYDPENADAALFDGNEWWGAPTDATRPVDPAVRAADFVGRTLAEYATLYDGSAGGTGFDISGFDLPRDAEGRKFIRFVRVTTLNPGDDTEVDAVSDVAPAPSFRNWVDANFAFAERPAVAKDTVCANGLPAFLNAALGSAPDDTAAPDGFAVTAFDASSGTIGAAAVAPFASDLVRLRFAGNLATPREKWTFALPLWPADGSAATLAIPKGATGGDAAFFVLEAHD